MAMLGDLQEFSLADLLHLMEKGKKTGQLSVWAPTGIYRVWLYQGRVVAALSPQEEHRLERLLVRLNLVSEQVVAELAFLCSLQEPLGLCLQRQGLISPAALAKLFRHQLQVGLYSLFALEAGQFSFLPNVPLPYREMTGLSKGASAVVLEALQQLRLDQRPEENLPQPDSYFWRTSTELPLYKLSPLEWAILEQISPTRNLVELAQSLKADLLEVRYACARLAKLGLLSPCDSSAATPQPALAAASKLLPNPREEKELVKPSLVSRLSTLLKTIREK
ncbi:DUF4388 domain-containing protein [Synechococcus sp. H55.11]|uniref:DUF4388 domain-containing protein n=1 Tax=Synechococcus sp. H55.11 TaxID=2967121 RepID=UPI0039C04500